VGGWFGAVFKGTLPFHYSGAIILRETFSGNGTQHTV
jgi:hypothetical protein